MIVFYGRVLPRCCRRRHGGARSNPFQAQIWTEGGGFLGFVLSPLVAQGLRHSLAFFCSGTKQAKALERERVGVLRLQVAPVSHELINVLTRLGIFNFYGVGGDSKTLRTYVTIPRN